MTKQQELKAFFDDVESGRGFNTETWKDICEDDRARGLVMLIEAGIVIKTDLEDGSATLSTPKDHPAADIFSKGSIPIPARVAVEPPPPSRRRRVDA
jgi:hypothetical protein